MASSLEDHVQAQLEDARDFFWHRLRWRALLDHLPAATPCTLVDVGAGAGLLGEFLAGRRPACRYRFVEPIPALEAALERRFGAAANYRRRDRYDDADFVTLMDVLEHVEDDRGFAAELSGRLRSGARLLVTVPALRSLWSGWDVELGHFRRYDKAALRAALAGPPWRIEELSYLHPELVPLGWLRRLRRRPASAGTAAGAARFPVLPKAANDLLYLLGLPSLRLRRWAPLGSSLLAVVRRD